MGSIYESLSGAGDLRMQGENQQRIEEYNAQVAEQEGKAAIMMSQFDQTRQAEEAERQKGKMIAEIGAAGGSGSPVAVNLTMEQAAEAELENLLIGYEGQVIQHRKKQSAALSRLQGRLAKESGKAAARQANIQFGLQLASLGGAA